MTSASKRRGNLAKQPYSWGCWICGGRDYHRMIRKIERAREKRAWKKDQDQ